MQLITQLEIELVTSLSILLWTGGEWGVAYSEKNDSNDDIKTRSTTIHDIYI